MKKGRATFCYMIFFFSKLHSSLHVHGHFYFSILSQQSKQGTFLIKLNARVHTHNVNLTTTRFGYLILHIFSITLGFSTEYFVRFISKNIVIGLRMPIQ